MIQQEVHICRAWQSQREGITLARSIAPSAQAICFPSLRQSDGCKMQWLILRPSPLSVSRSPRRLNVPTYPEGSFFVINSEQEAGKRLESYSGDSQRPRGSQNLWPIQGLSGQRHPRFPRISAGARPVACKSHWLVLSSAVSPTGPQIHTWINKNIKFLLVQVIFIKKLALHAARPEPQSLWKLRRCVTRAGGRGGPVPAQTPSVL